MVLTKNHREALIGRLKTSMENKEMFRKIMLEREKDGKKELRDWSEVDFWFISEIAIPALEKALIENNLENF